MFKSENFCTMLTWTRSWGNLHNFLICEGFTWTCLKAGIYEACLKKIYIDMIQTQDRGWGNLNGSIVVKQFTSDCLETGLYKVHLGLRIMAWSQYSKSWGNSINLTAPDRFTWIYLKTGILKVHLVEETQRRNFAMQLWFT